jgi:hypothetical protein
MKKFIKHILTIPQDHKDLEILGEELTNRRLRFRTHSKYIDGKFKDFPIPQLRGSCSGGKDEEGNQVSKEGHYINFGYVLRWNENEIRDIKEAIEATNQRTETYTFKFDSTSDYELEYDGDRSWDASFTFFAHQEGYEPHVEPLNR